MYFFYALLAAIIIAIMVVTNGQLSDYYDSYMASIIIHGTGFIAASIGVLIKKAKLSNQGTPIVFYIGGAIGVGSTLFTNLSYGKISVTAIIALGLFAQMVTSFFIDQFGWFGMPIKKVNLPKIIGLSFTFLGIIYLLKGSQFHLIAILLSLCTGVTIVLSRYVNAVLAEKTSVLVSTWYNFLVGLIVSGFIWLGVVLLGKIEITFPKLNSNLWIYFGGLLGVYVVALSCMCAKKISALILTLIMFIGQLFTGVLLDYVIEQNFSLQIVIGGVFTTVGFIVSLLPVRVKKDKKLL